MTTTTEPKVTDMAEGGYVVRTHGGTEAAREALRRHLGPGGEGDGIVDYCGPKQHPDVTDDDRRADIAVYVERLRCREGWYRWNPCHELSCYDGGGHSGHLGYVKGPGRGNWRGVTMDYLL